MPANGGCDGEWNIYINSTYFPSDETASIDCLECKIYKTRAGNWSMMHRNLPQFKPWNHFVYTYLDTNDTSTISTVAETTYDNETSKVTTTTTGVSFGESR